MRHVFEDSKVLNEMLFLRLRGWSLKELAWRYGCEHTSIRKQCIRYGLPMNIVLLPRPIITFRLVRTDWNGERINVGKTYQEYLKDEERRHSILENKHSKIVV